MVPSPGRDVVLDQPEHCDKLGKDEDLPALGNQFLEELEEAAALGALLDLSGCLQLDQGRVATYLAQFKQCVENGDA